MSNPNDELEVLANTALTASTLFLHRDAGTAGNPGDTAPEKAIAHGIGSVPSQFAVVNAGGGFMPTTLSVRVDGTNVYVTADTNAPFVVIAVK